jgi:hypothetical protein
LSSQVIDNMQALWTPDASGLWTLNASANASHLGEDGLGMSIVASSGSQGDPAPFAERVFSPALDLRGCVKRAKFAKFEV